MRTTPFILVVACMAFAFSTSAQRFDLGIKGGANLGKIASQSFSDQFTLAYHLGGFAEIGLGRKWSIQPEVLFNQVNADTTSQFSDIYNNLLGSNSGSIRLRYLSIPVLLNYQLTKGIQLQAGPQFGLLMDQNRNLLQNGLRAFHEGELSLQAGVQVRLSKFRFYGRYGIGLSNINDIDNQDRWRSQTIQLGVGLAIF